MTGRTRTRRRAALVGAAVCVGLTALSGCAGDPDVGTNGVGKLSANKIEKKSRKAAAGAKSVQVSGDVVTKGDSYTLDMQLKRNGGFGKVSARGGHTFELLRLDQKLYLKADVDFWARQGKGGGQPSQSDIRAASKLQNKYVKVPQEDPAYKQLSGFTDMNVMLGGLLVMKGERETGDRGEVDGVKTVRVQGGGGSGGIIDVALKGTPYPLRMERGGGAGVLELKDWNKDFALTAPTGNQVVDYGKQISANKG